MKPRALITLLVALLAEGCREPAADSPKADQPNAAATTAQVSAPSVVVYPLAKGTDIDAMRAWYNQFFGVEPDSAEKNYIRYMISNTKVVVVPEEEYARVTECTFYWQTANAEQLRKMFDKLKAAGNHIEPDNLNSIRVGDPSKDVIYRFVVTDPSGNKVGVINNPIYVPRLHSTTPDK